MPFIPELFSAPALGAHRGPPAGASPRRLLRRRPDIRGDRRARRVVRRRARGAPAGQRAYARRVGARAFCVLHDGLDARLRRQRGGRRFRPHAVPGRGGVRAARSQRGRPDRVVDGARRRLRRACAIDRASHLLQPLAAGPVCAVPGHRCCSRIRTCRRPTWSASTTWRSRPAMSTKGRVAALARDAGLNPDRRRPADARTRTRGGGPVHLGVRNVLGTGFASALKNVA